jgi:hypothetical protein
MHQFDVNFDAQDDNSVPNVGDEVRRDSDQNSQLVDLVGSICDVISPSDSEDDVIELAVSDGVFDHIVTSDRAQKQRHRPYLVASLTTILGLTLLAPPVVIPALPNGMALLDKPAYMGMISTTQYLVTAMYCLFVLLYYFPNAGLLTALESVTKKFLDSLKK